MWAMDWKLNQGFGIIAHFPQFTWQEEAPNWNSTGTHKTWKYKNCGEKSRLGTCLTACADSSGFFHLRPTPWAWKINRLFLSSVFLLLFIMIIAWNHTYSCSEFIPDSVFKVSPGSAWRPVYGIGEWTWVNFMPNKCLNYLALQFFFNIKKSKNHQHGNSHQYWKVTPAPYISLLLFPTIISYLQLCVSAFPNSSAVSWRT